MVLYKQEPEGTASGSGYVKETGKPTVELILDVTPVLHHSGRVSRPPKRYMYIGESFIVVFDEHDSNPTRYEEAIADVDADHWQKVMESKIESMYSNEIW